MRSYPAKHIWIVQHGPKSINREQRLTALICNLCGVITNT